MARGEDESKGITKMVVMEVVMEVVMKMVVMIRVGAYQSGSVDEEIAPRVRPEITEMKDCNTPRSI